MLVGADQEIKLGLLHFLTERAQRVHGIAGRGRPELALVDLVARLLAQRELQHRKAIIGAGNRRLPVAGLAGRHPQDLVELEVLERGARHGEVRVVDRIESAAEDANLQVRTSPWPSTTNFCVVRPSRPTGPRACSLSVEMPISAPRPYS